MDTSLAKRFIYHQYNQDKIYISESLEKIMDIDDDSSSLIGVYGVIETDSGPKMVQIDFAYDGHPIMLGTFVHEDYFLKGFCDEEIVYL